MLTPCFNINLQEGFSFKRGLLIKEKILKEKQSMLKLTCHLYTHKMPCFQSLVVSNLTFERRISEIAVNFYEYRNA